MSVEQGLKASMFLGVVRTIAFTDGLVKEARSHKILGKG